MKKSIYEVDMVYLLANSYLFTILKDRATFVFMWSHASGHPVNVSPIFTLIS